MRLFFMSVNCDSAKQSLRHQVYLHPPILLIISNVHCVHFACKIVGQSVISPLTELLTLAAFAPLRDEVLVKCYGLATQLVNGMSVCVCVSLSHRVYPVPFINRPETPS